jgi:hypothetical protein
VIVPVVVNEPSAKARQHASDDRLEATPVVFHQSVSGRMVDEPGVPADDRPGRLEIPVEVPSPTEFRQGESGQSVVQPAEEGTQAGEELGRMGRHIHEQASWYV